MSKRKSFAEATDSLLAAFANGGSGFVNSNFYVINGLATKSLTGALP
jgi:hypothetical protein